MSKTINIKGLELNAKNARKLVLSMVFRAQTSHVGSALSIIDILTILYSAALKISPESVNNGDRDRFILSKGHACTALYAVLFVNGFLTKEYIDQFCCNNGKLFGHPSSFSAPGIEFSTGSLGHGLSVAAGMALAGKTDGRPFRVFALLGDGECDEGQVWEAAMFASQQKLDNLTAIIDYNKLQGFGRTNQVISMEPFAEKWEAFGWNVREIDGHNLFEVHDALSALPFSGGRPSAVIAHTVKGKGVSFMEDKLEWHYKSPSAEQLQAALKELEIR